MVYPVSPARLQRSSPEQRRSAPRSAPIIVTRAAADIDAIVKPVRFDGWQKTSGGERAVKQALRQALLQYKLHSDQELFDRAYGYIKQYY